MGRPHVLLANSGFGSVEWRNPGDFYKAHAFIPVTRQTCHMQGIAESIVNRVNR